MGKPKKGQKHVRHQKKKQATPLNKISVGKIGKPQRSKKQKKQKPVDPSVGEGASLYRQIQRPYKAKNLPPKDEDNQEIPRKIQFYIDKKGNLDSLKRKRRKKKFKPDTAETIPMEKGMTRPFKPVPRFVQGKGENEKAFMSRVERETQRVLVKAQLEDKYKVDLDEARKGEITVKKRKKRNAHKIEKMKERKQKKLHKKQMKRLDQLEDTIKFKDEVKFGEVVMQPPSLTAAPRKAQQEKMVPRPGKRSLLLNQIIAQYSGQETRESPSVPKSSAERQPGQTLKRKYQSPAQQRMLDSEREHAIQSYRDRRGTHRLMLT